MKTRKTNGALVDFLLLRNTHYIPVFQERKIRERYCLTALISVVNKKLKTVLFSSLLILISKVFSLFIIRTCARTAYAYIGCNFHNRFYFLLFFFCFCKGENCKMENKCLT